MKWNANFTHVDRMTTCEPWMAKMTGETTDWWRQVAVGAVFVSRAGAI